MYERGFKSWCERYSVSIRQELNLAANAPLDPHALAAHLGILVWTPRDIAGLSTESLKVLLHNDRKTPSCWSAVTLVVSNKTVVILNSSHSTGRQSSDLMHEISHRILGHKTHEMDSTAEGVMMLSSYDKKQEDEADWLSGCLLLPRDALVLIKQRKMQHEDAARAYGVSVRMLKYRSSMTGINRQFPSSRSQ